MEGMRESILEERELENLPYCGFYVITSTKLATECCVFSKRSVFQAPSYVYGYLHLRTESFSTIVCFHCNIPL